MNYHIMQIDYMGVPSTAFVKDISNRWLLGASEAFVISKYLKEDVVKEIERKVQGMVAHKRI